MNYSSLTLGFALIAVAYFEISGVSSNVLQSISSGDLLTVTLPQVDPVLGAPCTVNVNPVKLVNFALGSLFLGNLQCNAGDEGQVESILPPNGFAGSCSQTRNVNGKYICNATCGSSNANAICNSIALGDSRAPVTAYPFYCKCATGGCKNGAPIPTALAPPLTAYKVNCATSSDCDCDALENDNTRYTGSICNWIPTIPNPYLSPIRWCVCCPSPNN